MSENLSNTIVTIRITDNKTQISYEESYECFIPLVPECEGLQETRKMLSNSYAQGFLRHNDFDIEELGFKRIDK